MNDLSNTDFNSYKCLLIIPQVETDSIFFEIREKTASSSRKINIRGTAAADNLLLLMFASTSN